MKWYLPLLLGLLFADAAHGACRFHVEAESGHQVAVGQGQLYSQYGEIEFLFSESASHGYIEVRFKPGTKLKIRHARSEVIQIYNENSPSGSFNQMQRRESLKRVKGWEYISGRYIAEFEMSKEFFSLIGRGFFEFDMDLSEADKMINPTGAVDTSDCAPLMNNVHRH